MPSLLQSLQSLVSKPAPAPVQKTQPVSYATPVGIARDATAISLQNATSTKQPNYNVYQPGNNYAVTTKVPSTSNPINTSYTTGGSGSSSQSTGGNTQGPTNAINNQVDAGNQQIEADYQNYLSSLTNQESSINSQAGVANQGIDTNASQARTGLQNQQATGIQGLDTQAQTANTQAASATQQARDLYRQVQQQNIAQLSGLGISSSSVSEALAEKLGVETARRIAGVTGSQQEILQNITKEKANLNDYVANKMSDLDSQVSQQKAQIQSQLMDGLNQINQARQVAASDKAARRQDLLINAQNAIATLQQQAQAFSQSLQTWQAQNTQKFSQVGQDLPQLLANLQAASAGIQGISGVGYDVNPSINLGTSGQISGQVSAIKKNPNDILNPFATPST